ncbi:ERCC4 domain-containing protein [Aphelenchoides fujianensis]|nr:ERCC4 domain-containing protein [Aphelenchoides fujianensis]
MVRAVNGQRNSIKAAPKKGESASKGRAPKITSIKRQIPIFVTRSTQNKENGEVPLPPKRSRFNTGVDKAEEKEFHLQKAIQSQKASLTGEDLATIAIPIPRVTILDEEAECSRIALLKERVQRRLSGKRKKADADRPASGEQCAQREDEYDLDEEDAQWLQQQTTSEKHRVTPEEFETIMETLENNSRRTVLTPGQACYKLPQFERGQVIGVYDYWLNKRIRLCKILPSGSLIPQFGLDEHNPYVAFMKREQPGERRRRSVRNTNTRKSEKTPKAEPRVKTKEEKEAEEAERLFNLPYRTDTNSELDGRFHFRRNPLCRFRMVFSLLAVGLVMYNAARPRMGDSKPQPKTQAAKVIKSKQQKRQDDRLALLPYEQQLILDTFVDDVVFVHARGLGLERLFLNHLHLYSDPSFTVIVLNTSPEDEHFFIEKLQQLCPSCPPKLLGSDVNSKYREAIYAQGGVQFVTARIFMVDLLMDRVPLERTAGIMVYRAHEVLTGYQASFILRLFREKKKNGFVKAFTDSPSAITGAGLGQLQRLVDRLYVKRVRIVPRFEEAIKATFAEAAPKFVEISVDLPAVQRRIRTCFVDIISMCTRELKQATPTAWNESDTRSLAAAALRPSALEIELRKKSLLLSDRQEKLLNDLRLLRKLLEKVENLDPVTVHLSLNELRTDKEFVENNSGWVLTPTASKVFAGIESQCNAKDEKGKPTIVAPPKWKALESVLNEIKEDLAKHPPSDPNDQAPVLVLASNEATCSQLIELTKFGSNKLCWIQSKLFAEYMKRSFGVAEPPAVSMWPPDSVANYDEQILHKDKKELMAEVKETQKKKVNSKRLSKGTRKPEIDPKQPRLVNFGIVRYAEKMAAKRPAKIDAETTSVAGVSTTRTVVEEEAEVVVIADDESRDSAAAADSLPVEAGGSSLVLPVLLFTTLTHRYNLIDCLESLKPRYMILYHCDIATTRVIEGFAAHHKPHELQLFALNYSNSTEEERYLTAMQNEQLALETLIKDQGALYVPTEYEVGRESTSSLRTFTLQTDSRRNRREQPDADEAPPMVIIDMREFNSELPTVVYKRGIDLHPAQLEVGDYVLSPSVCVERKALDDLAQSLNNGRVFKQVEQMLRHYSKSVLLIESSDKFRKKRVNGGPFQGELSKRSRDTRSLLTMLIRTNPRLIVFWSLSPSHSAELFEELKASSSDCSLLDEPNPTLDEAKGIRSDDLGTDEAGESTRLNSVVRRQLNNLPGVTSLEVDNLMRNEQLKTVADLLRAEASVFSASGMSATKAADLHSLLHFDFRGAPG